MRTTSPIDSACQIAAVALVLCAVVACAPSPSGSPGSSGSSGPASAASASPSSPSSAATPVPEPTLVDVGGRKMELLCAGTGGPVVVLDAGLGNTLDVWSAVMDRVAPSTTVCAYDRASLGRSEPRPPPHGAASAVDDLHHLLTAAHLAAPYVVVGASFGGIDAQLFARTYSRETAGVVLVDSLSAGWDDRLERILSPVQVADRRAIPNGEDISNEDIRASERGLLAAPPFPAVPLVVLRHDRPFPGPPDWPTARVEALWRELQDGLATLSPRSVELVGTASGHRIHQDQPDLVAAAILAIVDPTRWPPTAQQRPAFGEGAPAVAPGALHGRLWFEMAGGIWSASGDGSKKTLVIPDGAEPSIDQSAQRLVFVRTSQKPMSSGAQTDQPRAVWVRDLRSGTDQKLADDGIGPVISPDGKLVAYALRGHTYLVSSSGGRPVDLGEGGCPTWAPDSRRLAMCTNQDELFILDTTTKRTTRVATSAGPNQPTAWSPDGMQIALSSTRDGDGELYLTGVDGSGERRMTSAPGFQVGGPWTPHGILVTSSAPDADVSDWFLVSPVSGAVRAIPWMHGLPNPISWTPA